MSLPIRKVSLRGEPKPLTSIERTCAKCGASFIRATPGSTGQRGIWGGKTGWTWWCSAECAEVDV